MCKELRLLRGFSALHCEDCQSTEELTEHRINGRIKCVVCLNDQLRALEDKIEEKEGHYTESTYNELMQERNA
jgi:hypothetical protein